MATGKLSDMIGVIIVVLTEDAWKTEMIVEKTDAETALQILRGIAGFLET